MLKLKVQSFGHLMWRADSHPDTGKDWRRESWLPPWYWERLKAGREGDNRVRDDWMASTIWWTWVWVNSRSWWWTGKLGVLQSMGSQRVRQTEQLNWTELSCCCTLKYKQTAKDHWASEESSQYDKDPNNQKKQHRGNRLWIKCKNIKGKKPIINSLRELIKILNPRSQKKTLWKGNNLFFLEENILF